MTSKEMNANLKQNIEGQILKKRHRRTKAEMEEFRRQQQMILAKPVEHTADIKPKRHRRTKAEMEEARRQESQPKDPQPKAKAAVTKKRSVLKVGQDINVGDELMRFGGYVVNKADEKNFILSYKGLFQGYYGIDVQSVKAMMEKIGMGIIFREPKTNQEGLLDVNTILIALDKFEKFLRSEFLCRDGDGL